MTADDIRARYWAEPFAPFELVLADGRTIPVAKREHLSIAPTGTRLAVAPRMEELEFVGLPAVADVRPLRPATAAGPAG